MISLAISSFVRRQTADSEFSFFSGTDEQLISLVQENWHKRIPGQGAANVWQVPVSPADFYSSLIVLKEGDTLAGRYVSRVPGELPRKSTWAVGQKAPAKTVWIIVYSAEVLAKDNNRSSDADWEIISINATGFEHDGPMPMSVGTLLANHFHEHGSNDGGTSTGLSDSELVAKLKESYFFWRDKAFCKNE